MRFVIYAFLLLLVIIAKKRPYLTAVLYSLIFSLSLFMQLYISELEVNFFILVLLFALLINVIRDKLLKREIVLVMVAAIIFVLLQMIFVPITSAKIVLSLVRYMIVPFVAYYSVIYMKRDKINFANVFIAYFAINLSIVYYRTFIDYSFFGTIYDYAGTIYASSFQYGGVNFRPANLQSAIIFAIELIVFLFILYMNSENKERFYIFAAISIFPFYIMRSRSSFVLAIILVFYYLIMKKEYKKIIMIAIIGIVAFFAVGDTGAFFSVLDYKAGAYDVRFTSMANTITRLFNENINVLLLGKGVGTANTALTTDPSVFEVYVENFNISLIYDAGFIVFGTWVIWNIILLYRSFVKNSQYAYLFFTAFCLVVINNFSSNLSSYLIQLLYWQMIFFGTVKSSENVYSNAEEGIRIYAKT